MPIAYYGSRISPHMTKTPEGYLICYDVPINRIGVQEYMGDELGMQDSGKPYKVLREPEEVFSPAALASFEGKAITDGHPPESVTPDNIQFYGKGHAQNIRKGAGQNAGTSVADLFITDPQLIREIQDGKREISCGYTYDLIPLKNGMFEQRSIRGNHIAVVDEGRAGHRVAIKDEKPKLTERGKTMAEKKGSFLGRLLKLAANDESMEPEDLEKLSKLKDPEAEDELPEKEEVKPEPEVKPEAKDESPAMEALLQKVLEAIGDLKAMCAPKDSEDELEDLIHPEHEAQETPAEEAEESATGKEDEWDESPEEQEPSVTVPAEEISEKVKDATDEARKAAEITRGILQKSIKDPKAFKLAAKDAANEIRKAYGIQKDNSGYSEFSRVTSAAGKARAAKDSANTYQKMLADVQNAYDSQNPHNKGVK